MPPSPLIAPTDMVDRPLGPFRLVDMIGSGGFSAVFRARHEWLAAPFAVKVLLSCTASSLERFRNEARLGLRLRHPNIVAVCMAGRDAMQDARSETVLVPWIAADLAAGLTVTQLIQRSKAAGLSAQSAVLIAMQALYALEYVHNHGVVHGDIKPANVMVNRDGAAKLIDFGLSARIGSETHRAAGTVGFIAPEQWKGRHTITPAVDVYATGAMLWAMLAGHSPKPKTPGLCPLSPLEGICSRLQKVIDGMTAESAEERHTVAGARRALAHWLHGDIAAHGPVAQTPLPHALDLDQVSPDYPELPQGAGHERAAH